MTLERTDFSDIRVVATMSDEWGCGAYRTFFPYSVLKRHGADVRIIHMADTTGQKLLHKEDLEGANVISLQRFVDPAVIEWLRPLRFNEDGSKRDDAITVIYECDDDLTRLDPSNPSYKQFTPAVCRGIEKIVRASDALFVSTPELASRWARLNNRIFVLPNSIDFSFRKWGVTMNRHPLFDGKLVIGWAGGRHHIGDEAPLIPVMREILLKYDHVCLALCSSPDVMDLWIKRWRLADLADTGKWMTIQPVSFAQYPQVLSQFDIGLAPLMPSTFNMCKSYLRLIEYGAWGIPYVAQKIAPYQNFHKETGGLGGYLASGSQEWRDGLIRLIEDFEDRAAKSAAIKGVVRDSYNTDEVGLRWGAAIRAVQSGALSTWEPRLKPGNSQSCPCGSGIKYRRCCRPAWG